ncbi:MAG: PAS domain S-box protein [Acidobacteria bacterium]|nr:PAS domain S-box protein [Acidobacteriota bacterium]
MLRPPTPALPSPTLPTGIAAVFYKNIPASRYKIYARHAAVVVIVLGGVVALGWVFNLALFKSLSPGLVSMKFNTALCFILCGLALYLLTRETTGPRALVLVRAGALLAALIGLSTIVEYLTGREFNIDQWVFRDLDATQTSHPGRMAPLTGFSFLALGLALLLLERRRYWPAQAFALVVSLISLLSFSGYLYGVKSLYQIGYFTPMALHTVLGFSLLSFSILFANSEQAFLAIITSDTVGGVMARRMIPAAIFIPLAIGWVGLLGLRLRVYEVEFGVAALVLSAVVLHCLMIFWNARSLHLADGKRQHAEAASRQSEEKYRSIFENAIEGIFQSLPNGQVITANPALARMLGYDSSDALLLAFTNPSHTHLVDPTLREELFDRLAAHGAVQGFEAQLQCQDGKKIWVLISAHEIYDAEGELLSLEGIIEDITARKNLEEQLRQSQKMEAIGRLAGGIAHDFNNLLTAILGYSELIRSALEPQHPMRLQVEEIDKAGRRAAALTNQLLAFSRKQILQPRVLNLNTVINDMQKMLQRVIGEDIELSIHLDTALHHVRADVGQLEQVLLNLLVNARDAMPRGGTILLETRNTSVDEAYASQHLEAHPGNYVMLAISDPGIGMDSATLAQIFEPFFTTKEVGKGTGLGLSTVFGIIKQSQGYIQVYSEPGTGTSFKIYLPAVPAAALLPEVEVLPLASLTGWETVLLIEDDEMVRKLAHRILTLSGYQALVAVNAEEAFSLCQQHAETIHLILSDVVMPKMSGPELVGCLLAMRPDSKVLYMSGYTTHRVLQQGLLESTPFIQKPFTPDSLQRKLREVLDTVAVETS